MRKAVRFSNPLPATDHKIRQDNKTRSFHFRNMIDKTRQDPCSFIVMAISALIYCRLPRTSASWEARMSWPRCRGTARCLRLPWWGRILPRSKALHAYEEPKRGWRRFTLWYNPWKRLNLSIFLVIIAEHYREYGMERNLPCNENTPSYESDKILSNQW